MVSDGKWLWRIKLLVLLCLAGAMLAARAEDGAGNAIALRTRYASLNGQLQHNQFKRPLVLESIEKSDQVNGDVHALVDYPFDVVRTGLDNPNNWCDILLLHINTKYCHAGAKTSGTILEVNIGKKTEEPLKDSSRIEFNYRVAAMTPDYFKITLNAKDGPMGTHDYRIVLEAVALSDAKTFIHLTYSYSTGMVARLAMRTYLATAGSSKVGFTVVGRKPDGSAQYIDGVRGLIERNTMRYYLAIDAFLSATKLAPELQLEKRLQAWFAATEHYPRQLHEVDRDDYLRMKRSENMRMQRVTMR